VLDPIEPDPVPRPSPDSPSGIGWPTLAARRCSEIIRPNPTSFAEVVEARRSVRALTYAPLREVVNSVAFAMRPIATRATSNAVLSRRPSVSAGALHSVEIVLADWRATPRLMRYEPHAHELQLLGVSRPNPLEQLRHTCSELLPEGRATVLAFVGDVQRISAFYHHSESLLWRDAGALLQILATTASAYRLGFCPLGILGSEIVDALSLDRRYARPLGCAVIGRAIGE